jgi:hypothetical protein
MAQTDLPGPDDARWADALNDVDHDIYHVPDYVRRDAWLCGGTPVAFHVRDGDRVLLPPLVLRGVPGPDQLDAPPYR